MAHHNGENQVSKRSHHRLFPFCLITQPPTIRSTKIMMKKEMIANTLSSELRGNLPVADNIT